METIFNTNLIYFEYASEKRDVPLEQWMPTAGYFFKFKNKIFNNYNNLMCTILSERNTRNVNMCYDVVKLTEEERKKYQV